MVAPQEEGWLTRGCEAEADRQLIPVGNLSPTHPPRAAQEGGSRRGETGGDDRQRDAPGHLGKDDEQGLNLKLSFSQRVCRQQNLLHRRFAITRKIKLCSILFWRDICLEKDFL